MKRIVLLLALLGSAAHAQKSESGMPDTAFVFEARIAVGSPVSILGVLAGGTAFTAVPSLFLGARLIDRLHVGLGLQFFRLQSSAGGGPFGGGTNTTNVIEFVPTVAADLFKSHDNRAAFYLKFGLPLGPVVTCQPGNPCDDNFAVGFDFGLGVRYALHRNFALGLEAGAGGAFIGPQRNNTTGEVSFYGALVGTFFSGH